MTSFTESIVEDAALSWLETLGWRVAHGPDIAPDTPDVLAQGPVSAVQVLGDEILRAIARELVETVRSNVTIAGGAGAPAAG